MADETFTPWTAPGTEGRIPDAWLSEMVAYLQQHPLPVLASQVTGYQRTISGYILSTGAIDSATPASTFTVSHTGTGTYTITFKSGYFTKRPAVVGNTNTSGNTRFVVAANVTKDGFDAEIFNLDASLRDNAFSFFAQGS